MPSLKIMNRRCFVDRVQQKRRSQAAAGKVECESSVLTRNFKEVPTLTTTRVQVSMRAGWDLSLNWIMSKSLDCIVCFIDSGFIDCPRAPLAVPITTNVCCGKREKRRF